MDIVPAEWPYGESAPAHYGESGKKKFFEKKSQICSLC